MAYPGLIEGGHPPADGRAVVFAPVSGFTGTGERRAALAPSGVDARQELFEEGFVDFRFVITMHRDLFATFARPIALTRDGVLDLYFSWMRHTIGPQVQRKAPCPSCSAEVEVFPVAEDFLRPQPDY